MTLLTNYVPALTITTVKGTKIQNKIDYLPELVRDVAKFLGFVQFYSRFIPNFEIRVEALRTVTKQDYTKNVRPHWTPEAQAAWEDLMLILWDTRRASPFTV